MMNNKKTLDFGCGNSKIPHAVGVDMNPRSEADVVHDLNVFPYPFAENEFDEVNCDSILEHLEDIFRVMEEIHRITVPGGLIRVTVPYYTSFDAYTDPTHRHFFTSRTFDYFREGYAYSYYSTVRFEILETRLTFLKLKQLGGISPHKLLGIEFLANKAIKVYEAFFAYIFPAQILSFTLQVTK